MWKISKEGGIVIDYFIKENPKLFLDVDGTITDSISAYCKAYNYYYRQEYGFIEAKPELVKSWDMLCQCPLTKERYSGSEGIEKLFASDKFFSELNFIDEYAYDSIKELSEIYDIIICSMGTSLNISKKIIWIEKHLPFVKKFRYIDLHTDKSEVLCRNSILIDDSCKNLIYSGVERPIIFIQREFDWNRSWGGEKVYNWLETRNLLKTV